MWQLFDVSKCDFSNAMDSIKCQNTVKDFIELPPNG